MCALTCRSLLLCTSDIRGGGEGYRASDKLQNPAWYRRFSISDRILKFFLVRLVGCHVFCPIYVCVSVCFKISILVRFLLISSCATLRIEPLYKRSLKLVEQLIEWKSEAPTLPARIEALWVYLYERGYIEIKDVELVQAWLQSLFAAG